MDSDEDDSDAFIKPAKKTKPTAQSSMTDFLEKNPGASKAAAKAASKTITPRKASDEMKAPAPQKMGKGTGTIGPVTTTSRWTTNLKSALVMPCTAAPRRAAAAKAA